MRWRELPDTPFWALFRLKWKQTWPRSRIRKALLAFAIIVALQGVVTYIVYPALGQGGRGGVLGFLPGRTWVLMAASWLGLFSPAWMVFLAPGHTVWTTSWGSDQSIITWVPYLLVGTMTRFIMPAFAALAIAPDRESGRLDEHRLTGLSRGQILLAAALASLLPFAAATLLALALHLAMAAVLAAGATSGTSVSAFIEHALRSFDLPRLLTSAGSFVLHAGVLVSISALCRHTRTAPALCYAVPFLLLPIISYAVLFAVMLPSVQALFGSSIAPPGRGYTYLSLVPQVLLAIVLLPRAIRAVERDGG